MTPSSGVETLHPSASAAPEAGDRRRQAPAAAVAATLLNNLASRGAQTRVHLASSERRADEIARALAGFAPDLDVILLPPWDCLPYDRASPSRDVMARRMAALERLVGKTKAARIVVVSPEALAQRLPPPESLAHLLVTRGERLDRAAVARFAAATGYVADDRIDEPGEIAILGEVIDIFPADAEQPVRIVLGDDDVVTEIRTYDALTQRSVGELDCLRVGAASELITAMETQDAAPRAAGIEHGLAAHYGALPSLFDLIGKAVFSQDDKAAERLERFEAQVLEAHEARVSLSGIEAETPPAPTALYILGEALGAAMDGWTPTVSETRDVTPFESLAGARNPGRAFCDMVDQHHAARRRVVLTGLAHEQRALARALARGLDRAPTPVASWADVSAAEPGALLVLNADLDAGFVNEAAGVAVIAAPDVMGGRIARRPKGDAAALLVEPELRIGDVVIHEDHGVGVLRDLQTVVVDSVERDTLKLEYHGGASLLVPVEDIGRVWRYGAEEAAVTLDRLKGDAWFSRRAEVSRHIEATARSLVEMARRRQAARCAPITPPKAAYAKFAARFAFPETQDQAAAIEAVLADLASGRPMDRLVCGDVGFGKTEVALRAAAVVALSGRQVALVAPTTVLARQHVQTLQRRFAGTGLRVAQLSRLVSAAEAASVREALASGEIAIVVGTHAIVAGDTRFADLGLVIIDEEQKFGAAMKAQLRDLAADGHLLTLTATPIPRTLQAAMIGLQDVSVIASPPARRRPIRTFLAPYDAATVSTALMREKRRGGQSFVVVPRIEDIEPLAEKLQSLVPELGVWIAHGGLKAEAVDEVMVAFADGDGDVLLATNIIESGLDVPRANTMLIWRPDRFGLSQLHQLRGRVGRGRPQGIAYLLSDPQDDLSDATRARLSTLEAFDRLGSGLAISARDLDLRGGGDLVGDEQAGHMKLIGAALYQRVLSRAVRVARGETVEDAWTPELKLGEVGAIPSAYVPDPVIRINLYARLARLEDTTEIDDFEEELQDRFGPPPAEAVALLGLARLQRLAYAAGARTVSAGPKGVAITLTPARAEAAMERLGKRFNISRRDDRLVAEGMVCGVNDYGGVERLLLALL